MYSVSYGVVVVCRVLIDDLLDRDPRPSGGNRTEVDSLLSQSGTTVVVDRDRVQRNDGVGTEPPACLGVDELANYIVNEIQDVYRLQGVKINDKHIEVIVRQMMRKCRILNAGESRFLIGETLEVAHVRKANEQLIADGKKPAVYELILLGITKASLATESFISAASFQETTKVLTEAALRGAKDDLKGLKENVLLGHLVPAGTGFSPYQSMRVKYLVDPIPTDEDNEDTMLHRVTQRAEALGAQAEGPTVQIPSPSTPVEAGEIN